MVNIQPLMLSMLSPAVKPPQHLRQQHLIQRFKQQARMIKRLIPRHRGGHRDRLHPGGVRGGHAECRILQSERRLGRYAQQFAGPQVRVRVRLMFICILAADSALKVIEQTDALQVPVHPAVG